MKQVTRLFVAFGGIVVLIGIFGVVAIYGMNELAGLTERMHHHPLMVSSTVRDIKIGIVSMHRSMKDVTLAQTKDELDTAVSEVDSSEQQVFEHFDTLKERFLGDASKVESARIAFLNWRPIRAEVIALMRGHEQTRAAAITKGKGADHVEKMNRSIDAMIEFANLKAKEFHDEAETKRSQMTLMMGLLLGGILILSGLVAVFVIRKETEDRRERKRAEEVLRESVEKFKSLYTSMNEGMALHKLLYDTEGKAIDYVLEDVNPAFETILGLKADDVQGRKASIVYGTAVAPYLDVYANVVKTGQSTQFETEYIPLEKCFSIRVFSPDKEHFVTVFEDITERKRAEEAIRESEEKLNLIIDTSRIGICTVDLLGNFITTNLAYERMLGYSKKELSGLSFFDVTHPDNRPKNKKLFQEMFSLKTSGFSMEKKYIRQDGTVVEVAVSAVGIADAKGNTRFGTAFVEDITERKQAEEDLRRLATVISDSNDAVILHDFDGNILAWNRGAIETYGYTEAEVLGTNVREIVAEAGREAALTLIERIKQGEVIKSFELQRVTKDGRILDVWLTTTLLADETGKPVAIATTERNITERKQAEEEVLRLNAELEQRVLDRTAELQAANRELEAFTYSVSHDLRAPLRHLTGFSELVQKNDQGNLDDKTRRHLAIISDSAVQMGQLIDSLLAFSRTGRTEMHKDLTNLDDLVKEVINNLPPEPKERRVIWQIAPLPSSIADATLLRAVLTNLFSNALKFTRPRDETKIQMGCHESESESETIFFIRDNGVGFDMKYVEKLFGVFQRLHTTEQFEGTGIGLANVQRIIQRHGGRTWAESVLNESATFYFSLPKPTEDKYTKGETI